MKNKDYGPNITKLILKIVSIKAIPKGGGIADGIEFFKNQELRHQILDESEAETIKMINIIKSSPDNPYKDDEEIAGALLEKINEKKMARG